MAIELIPVRHRDDPSQTRLLSRQQLLVFGHLWEPIPDENAVEHQPGESTAASQAPERQNADSDGDDQPAGEQPPATSTRRARAATTPKE